MEFVFFLAEKFLPCTKSEIRNLYCFQGVSRKQIQNSNFQMFKTLWFSLEYDFLRFGHLNFGNLRIVSDFDLPAMPLRYSYKIARSVVAVTAISFHRL